MWDVFFFLNDSNKVFQKNDKSGLVDIYMCYYYYFFISTCLLLFFFFFLTISTWGVFFLLNNNKVLKKIKVGWWECSYFVGTILVQVRHVFYQIIL